MKRNSLLLIFLLCLLQHGFAQRSALDSLIENFRHPKPGNILAAAHRGDWRNAPENSMDALKRCLDYGVDIMETDIQLTKDGVPVIMHDKTIDRTTTGKGKVSNWTLDSLRTLKLRHGHGVPSDEKIPTLEEMMLAVKGKPILINLDKSWSCLRETYDVLKKTGTVQQGIFKGPDPLDSLRKKYGSLMDSIIYMPMVWPMETEPAGRRPETPKTYVDNFIRQYRPVAYEMVFDKEDSPVLTEALPAVKAAHATVWINTLWNNLCAGHTDEKALTNPNANWGWVIEKGANIIQTDRIPELLAYLRKKGVHK